MKKPKVCLYCNEKLGQGHRVDRCKKPWGKTQSVSKNRIYIRPKHSNEKFEIIETEHAVAYVASGACKVGGRVVSGEEHIQSLIDLRDACQNRINEATKSSKKN